MILLLARYWHFAAIGVLTALLTGAIWHIGNLKDDLAASRSAHKADIAFWKQAGVLAVTRAKEAKARLEAAQDKVTTHANDDYSRRAAAFDERVRFTPAVDQRSPAGADLPSLPYAASVFDGPGPDAVIPKTDARLCGLNTLRLIAAREWVLSQQAIDREPADGR